MSNPLIAGIKLPGRSFQLPSKGIFYKNGELSDDIKDGILHVKALSAIDEITFKNPDLLLSGEAINIFKNSIDGLNKPRELLSKDVDAITFFLRTVSYGPHYEFDVEPHDCKDAKHHSYSCNIDESIVSMKIIDEKTIDDLYSITVTTGQSLKLRPYIYDEIISIINKLAMKKQLSSEDEKQNVVDTTVSMIESVDGISDREQIKEWVMTLPTKVINSILNKGAKANATWGLDMNVKIECKDCGELIEIALPINPVSFFTE